jgi:hypothetical protein
VASRRGRTGDKSHFMVVGVEETASLLGKNRLMSVVGACPLLALLRRGAYLAQLLEDAVRDRPFEYVGG